MDKKLKPIRVKEIALICVWTSLIFPLLNTDVRSMDEEVMERYYNRMKSCRNCNGSGLVPNWLIRNRNPRSNAVTSCPDCQKDVPNGVHDRLVYGYKPRSKLEKLEEEVKVARLEAELKELRGKK